MTLRDLNNLAFLHRERARFSAGTSVLLGVTLEPGQTDGIVIDVREVTDLYRVVPAAGGGATAGAFVSLAALAAGVPGVVPGDTTLAGARMRLALHDAHVVVYGRGSTRNARFDDLSCAPYEIPALIAIPPPAPGIGIAERRRATQDGAASFALGVSVALRVSLLGRFERVRVLVDLDGAVRRTPAAEAALEGQRCERDRFPDVARLAAAAIPPDDARSSAIARSLLPLALAALRDAFAAARPA